MTNTKTIGKSDLADARRIIEIMEKLSDEQTKMMLMLLEGYIAGIDSAELKIKPKPKSKSA